MPAEHFHLGDAVDSGEHRLHHPRQVFAQRRRGQRFTGKADIGDGGSFTGGALNHRIVSLLWQQRTWLTLAITSVNAWVESRFSAMRTVTTLRPCTDEDER